MLPLPRARHEILRIMAGYVDTRVGVRPFLVLLGIKGISRGVDGMCLTVSIVSEIPVAGVHHVDSRQAEHGRVGMIVRCTGLHRAHIALHGALGRRALLRYCSPSLRPDRRRQCESGKNLAL